MTFLDDLQHALGSAYRVEREFEGGGMARVVLAEERRLQRKVVIKVLVPTIAAELDGRRFEREIAFAAQLQHPQIVPVLAAGDANGMPFYTMPYIEGESLAARLGQGPLDVRDAIDVLRDVAKALSYAHSRGVVHRDIKPANILLTTGVAVVADFGIAKALAASRPRDLQQVETGTPTVPSALTRIGVALGTPAYMAPEQIAADPALDHRVDIYALGCVAFEMVVGTPPFTGSSLPALFAAHLTERPPAIDTRLQLPPALTSLIEQCLEKEPSRRPATAAILVDALDRARAEVSGAHIVASAARSRPVSIAVLPFRDLAADTMNEHLGIGLADAAITDLACAQGLLVRPTSAVMPYRDRTVEPLRAARDLSVDAIVDGSFQRSGNRLRITVQLIEAATGASLWGTRLTTSMDDVFVVQDEVARRIVESFKLPPASAAGLSQRPERSPGEAYHAYLRGRALLLSESLEETTRAIECFQGALAIDPSFARAYGGLADAYARLAFTWIPEGDGYARAQEMCERALTLDPQLPEAHYLRGRLRWTPQAGFDHSGAMREFVSAIAAQPGLNEAHHWLGILMFHVSMLEESIDSLERALAIDPGDRIALMNLAYAHHLAGRSEQALKLAADGGPDGSSAWSLYTVALAHLQLGSLDLAAEAAASAARRYPGDVLFHPIRALLAALQQDRDRALQMIAITTRNQRAYGHYHHAQYDVACTYAQLGEIDLAMTWLTDAATNGFPCGAYFERDRLLDPVRADARFGSLQRSVEHERAACAGLYRALRSDRGKSPELR